MRSALLACLLGGSLGTAACLLDLDDEMACGDGFTDRSRGEDCDPADIEGFGALCGGRGGTCNPRSCRQECCGDWTVNGEEECDGPNFGLAGPQGESEGLETCRGLTLPGTEVPYSSGVAGCTSECRIDRSECTLCGNGQVDRAFAYADGSVLPAEVCDSGLVRLEELRSVCTPACDLPSTVDIVCNVECNGCRLLTVSEPKDCCYPEGAVAVDPRYPCCCRLEGNECAIDDISPGDAEGICPPIAVD